eukprot:1216305-Rhodomonas_salina.1
MISSDLDSRSLTMVEWSIFWAYTLRTWTTDYMLHRRPACQMPMQKGYTVSEKDLAENPKQEHITLLRAMLGSLSYLMTWSRPEILLVVYQVNLLACYTSKASPALIEQAKKIF